MLRDLHESLADIHNGPAGMKEQIWEIQPYIIPRSSTQKWAQNLRFITHGYKPAESPMVVRNVSYEYYDEVDYDDDDNDDHDHESSPGDANMRFCDCVKMKSFPSDPKSDGRRRRPALHITAPGDVKGCNHYVAVSYRWPKRDSLPDKALDECFTVHTKTAAGSRTNLAPTNVLERAMSFAEFNNYKLIWIDQECIEQRNDSQDKDSGIQSMDLVFQNASASVALLGGCIDEQRHLDAFFDLVEIGQPDMSRDDLISALEVLEIIFRDEWHSRAWCFQEVSVSTQQMRFLIRRNPSLVPKQGLAEAWCAIPGELEIDVASLVAVVSSLFAYETKYPDLRGRMQQIVNLTSSIAAVGMRDDSKLRRYEFNAAQAINYLLTKNHSRIPDALAILANLCNYSLRLNTVALTAHENARGSPLSLSTCIYALSIINGDLSLLCSTNYSAPAEVASSWIPNPRTTLATVAWRDMDYPVILQDCKIRMDGLELRGILWSVDQRISLHAVQNQFLSRWLSIDPDLAYLTSKRSIYPSERATTLNSMELEILKEILDHLYSQGLDELAHTLWDGIRRVVRGNRQLLPPETRNKLPQEFAIFESLKWLNVHEYFQSKPGTIWVATAATLRWVIRRCLTDGSLLVGRPAENIPVSAGVCVFDLNEPSVVFSPLQRPGRRAWLNVHKLHFPMSWIIKRYEPETGILEVNGLVNGTWSECIARDSQAHRVFVIS